MAMYPKRYESEADMKTLKYILISLFTVLSLSSCGGNLTDLANNILYPFADVNKSYPVPELPPDDLKEVIFEVLSTDGSINKIHSWVYQAPNPTARVFVYFHGNGENLQALYEYNFIGVLKKLGVHFIIIDYPGLGRSTGAPNQANLVNAALAAIDWADAKYKSSPVVVWGRSIGAAVATQAAALRQDRIQGLILTSPWNKFIDVALERSSLAKSIPKEWLEQNSYDSALAATNIRLLTLIHHGVLDTLIPIKFGRILSQSFPEQGYVLFNELLDKDHNDIFTNQEMWQDIKNFIR